MILIANLLAKISILSEINNFYASFLQFYLLHLTSYIIHPSVFDDVHSYEMSLTKRQTT